MTIFRKIKEKINFYLTIQRITHKYQTIYIVSAAGYTNVGDDLMLSTLNRLFKNKEKYFLVAGINNNKKVISNVKKIGLTSIDSLEKINNKNSIILIGGGTLFNTNAFKNEIYLKYAKKILDKNIDFGFIGIGITDIKNKDLAKLIFTKSKINTVRNKQSFKKIYKITQTNKNTLIVGDIAEHYNYPKKIHKKQKDKIIGICLSRKNTPDIKYIVNLIKIFKNNGFNVILFSFANHPFEKTENDFIYAKEIKKETDDQSIKIISAQSPISEIIASVQECDFIITNRLHTTIIAHKTKTKVINISKENKCVNYCKNNNIPRITKQKKILTYINNYIRTNP